MARKTKDGYGEAHHSSVKGSSQSDEAIRKHVVSAPADSEDRGRHREPGSCVSPDPRLRCSQSREWRFDSLLIAGCYAPVPVEGAWKDVRAQNSGFCEDRAARHAEEIGA